MKVKRLICLVLALAMALCLAACESGSFVEKLDGKLSAGSDTDSADMDGDGADTGAGTDGSGDTDTDGGTDDGDTALPDYTGFSQGLDDNGYFDGVTALEHVTLPEFGDLVLPEFPHIMDRAVEDGDFVNIDYVGSVDGVEFDGGSTGGAGSDVIIGVTSFIDDFLEQVVGHMPGENFDIEVTFPDPYQSEDLAGKDAVFNITVNYIWDISDESARAIGFTDRDEMAQYVAYNYYSVEEVIADPAVNVLLAASSCGDVPDTVVETVRNHMSIQLDVAASQYGVDADTIASLMYGVSAQEYLDSGAAAQAEWCLIFQALAERESIAVTDEDITEYEYESLVEVYGMPFVKYSILQEKVIDYINENVA